MTFHEKPPVGAQTSQPSRVAGRTYRREMDDLNASLCDLPVELKVLVLSHIEHVETGQILGLSSDVWEALSLLRALQQAFYFEGVAGDDIADHLVLRVLRGTWPALKRRWPKDKGPEEWDGVRMVDGRVEEIQLLARGLTGAVPAEIGQLTSLKQLWLGYDQLTSVPAEIGQLTALEKLKLNGNRLTSLPAAIRELIATGCDVKYGRQM